MAGDGSLEISADPDDVEVVISRMDLNGRVLRPADPRSLGKAPIPRFEISIGSYLLTLRRAGEREIYRPVLVGRTEGGQRARPLSSGRRDRRRIHPGAGGSCDLGGDSIAHGGLDRRIVDVEEFAIRSLPGTCEEYLAFVNAVADEAGPEVALRHIPRARAQEGHYWRFNRLEGKFEYPEKSPGGHSWVGNLPVSAISMIDADAYISWRSTLTGDRLRLPHENEWEKAARGVDGRFFLGAIISIRRSAK